MSTCNQNYADMQENYNQKRIIKNLKKKINIPSSLKYLVTDKLA